MMACNNQAGNNVKADSAATSAAAVVLPIDTVVLGDKVLLVYPLEKSAFLTEKQELYSDNYSDSTEQVALTRDSAWVTREADSLRFVVKNGNGGGFKNNDKTDGDDYVRYYYKGLLSDIGYYCVSAAYYESGETILVSQATGERVNVWDMPLISPDKKTFLCFSYDLVAGFVPNGIQLYTVNNGKAEQVADAELTRWGPGRMKWVDNKTLEGEYITLDSANNELIRPVKLVLQ
ncbi:hypothetical protein SAMN05421788_11068 [Filimonas lacunae]|uniref:Uncharacterized protein n=2 Tax=Filimonas lacunae TaxID=477680 RepID=A0A173M9Z9_9BACT|nr:hypothetical protein FLA_0328 [Filimonas lacunae]SIT31069.1 hypothetical protein SAMN05421788_11068 [Filimonas lacunae]